MHYNILLCYLILFSPFNLHAFRRHHTESQELVDKQSKTSSPQTPYTRRDSRIRNFANPGAPDLRPTKQPISGGDMGDADGLKDGDAGAGKNPIHELRCVYSLIPPKGWSSINDKKQLPGKVALVYIGNGEAGQFIPSVNLALEETPLTLEEYVSLAKEYHETQGETICTRLGNIETGVGAAQILQIDRKTGWGDVRFIQAATINEGIAYVITATCLKEDFPSYCVSFFKAIQSFTLNREHVIKQNK